jgi:hypothetical protein
LGVVNQCMDEWVRKDQLVADNAELPEVEADVSPTCFFSSMIAK